MTHIDLLKQNSSTREDLGTLAVMEALAEEEQVTQRELSRKTGLNLKKVNYTLHKLLEKGHIKFQRALNNPDKRAYLYILTPSGVKAKSWLTYRFLSLTLQFYSQVEEKLNRCLFRMKEGGVERLLLGGVSDVARIVIEQVDGSDISVISVVDNGHEDSRFGGVRVVRERDVGELEWDGILITTLDDVEEFDRRLRSMGLPEDKIWHLS